MAVGKAIAVAWSTDNTGIRLIMSIKYLFRLFDQRPLRIGPTSRPDVPMQEPLHEISFTATTLPTWMEFVRRNMFLLEPGYIDRCVRFGLDNGISSNFLGPIRPNELSLVGENVRETFLGRGFTPRQRLLFDVIYNRTGHDNDQAFRIYAHEALSNFALTLRGRYPRFLGSEFTTDEELKAALFPIPIVDVTASPFPDACFDIIISGDVLEHVSDLHAALTDTRRILAPGGQFLATFPFHSRRDDVDRRAVLENGQVRYLREPEYHGDPIHPGLGSLVFQIPTWQIVNDALAAGFSRAEFLFQSSPRRGIIGSDIAGIFVFRAFA